MDGIVHSVLKGLNTYFTPTYDLSHPNTMDGRVHSVLKGLKSQLTCFDFHRSTDDSAGFIGGRTAVRL